MVSPYLQRPIRTLEQVEQAFKPGDIVYLKASKKCFDAVTGKTGPAERRGPLTVEKVYSCGTHLPHMRLKAITNSPAYNYHDGAFSMFEHATDITGCPKLWPEE